MVKPVRSAHELIRSLIDGGSPRAKGHPLLYIRTQIAICCADKSKVGAAPGVAADTLIRLLLNCA